MLTMKSWRDFVVGMPVGMPGFEPGTSASRRRADRIAATRDDTKQQVTGHLRSAANGCDRARPRDGRAMTLSIEGWCRLASSFLRPRYEISSRSVAVAR
jgi:hypothetical protein